jgi:virginiamycin B lyase
LPTSFSKITGSSSRKIAVYAIVGIVAVGAVYVFMSVRGGPALNGAQDQGTAREEVTQRFKQQFCGTNTAPNSNAYIAEVTLPNECEMPLGIAADGGRVWYVSTKRGVLGSYDTSAGKFSEYEIPQWPSRQLPFAAVPSWSMSWDVKLDGSGNVWFTDQNNTIWRFNKSTDHFDMFKVPAKYPSTLDFDRQGNIYFIGINSQSLFFGDLSKMKNTTSDGFTEIRLPLDTFSGINLELVTSGGLVVDNQHNNVWVSLLSFQAKKGELLLYDIGSHQVTKIVDLPPELGAPVGMELDNSGNLWVADHGTSTFFKYNPANGNITKFVTSIASSKIFGGSTPSAAYTLPYWIHKGADGSLWFNEHTGNKIARFDPQNLTMVEYWIPSQNRGWAICPEGASPCGIANAMQFTTGPNNQIWFTEWTENKIAKLDASKQVPIEVSAPVEFAVEKGQSKEIKLTISASSNFTGQMMAAGTFMPNAGLGNSTGVFSEQSVSVTPGVSKEISYTFTPAEDLSQGQQYTIMVGTGNDDISYMRAVKVNIL